MVVTFHRLTRSLPLDIDAKVSFYNLSPAPTVISFACGRGYNSYSSSPSRSNNKRFGGASSALEHLYNATDGTNNFDKVVDFLGTMAEAELRVSRPTVSPHPPRNIPFLTGNGGGHNKAGVKEDLGQYDAKGVLRTSSLKQQRKDYAP
jgi:hypothetical protein